jgi:hypothetical protein
MSKIFLSLPFAAFFLACANNPQTEQTPVVAFNPPVVAPTSDRTTCYEMTDKLNGKTRLQLVIAGQNVTGTLDFRSAKGERVTGTLVGTTEISPDQTLIRTIYTQSAQGRKYVNERYFKIEARAKEQTLLVGEGEQKQDALGVFRYKKPEKVQYKRVMKAAKC